ncbi:MAG: DUF2617 family protein [Planctomycetaceae bacterium]|jgi:hypothetical protein|nr:DUF2617 family protein [Planctomycetaceae bacterium]
MIVTRPCISEFSLLHYAKPIHPEFFRIVAVRDVLFHDYQLSVWLTSMGHVVTFSTHASCGSENLQTLWVAEILASAHLEMPQSPVSVLQPHYFEHKETIHIGNAIRIDTAFQRETYEADVFLAMQNELAKARELEGVFYHFGSNGRIALGGLSYITLEKWQRKVRICSYHTFPENCRILKTNSLFCWE